MTSPSTVSYRFGPVPPAGPPISLTDEQMQVTGNTAARLRVLAGPGTGKTTTLVEAVAHRVEVLGVPPERILVLTFSRRAAEELTGRISRRLALTTRETMVRTLHSYAYSVLRTQAAEAGEPSPRLLAAGESDQMVRDLLGGHLADGGGHWPGYLTGALSSPTFATELREILLRAAGQGVPPARMVEIGRRHKRQEWIAAGQFAREYQQVSDLRQGISGFGVALDQAELTAAALGALRRDEVLAAEQRRIRRIFVDEYQDVDPAQARLISVLSAGADELVVMGDPDQSIYAFRGAEPTAMQQIDVDASVALTLSRRSLPELTAATRRVARLLPGTATHRQLRLPDDVTPDASGGPGTQLGSGQVDTAGPVAGAAPGAVEVRVFPTGAREASYIADALRRAHLLDGVPWGSMAILLRAPSVGLAALTRACVVAGVPVVLGGSDEVLSAEPVVAAFLTVLECGVRPATLTGERATELLSSPLGGVDALGLRRLRRAVRAASPQGGSSADLLAAVLAGAPLPETVPADLSPALRRMRSLLSIASDGASSPAAEAVLWQLWQASGLQESLVAAVERGGSAGQRADRALDAVLGLFAMATDLSHRLPLAGVDAFITQVRGRQLPGEHENERAGDAVVLLSAHASKGLEWDVVAVAGVQEGTWPDLRSRGSLLGGQELLDLASGLPGGNSAAGLLAEERRLFYVATTRARRQLVCTAVLNQDVVPSRFLQELAGTVEELSVQQDGVVPFVRHERRGLHLTDLLADLRRAVTDPALVETDGRAAARHLAELARAGVPAARPEDWYGLAAPSTGVPPIPTGERIRVSPSLIESLESCALRAVLERRGGRTEPGQAQIEGIVVHAMAHGLALGVGEVELRAEIDLFLTTQDRLPPWQLDRTRRGLLAMLEAARAWVRDNHPTRTLLGSEVDMDVTIPPEGPPHIPTGPEGDPEHEVHLVGRVDWLSQKPDGSVVVTDFKTGATPPTKAEAQANPQLAAYQAAITLGAFSTAGAAATPGSSGAIDGPGRAAGPLRPGGAELVFLRSGRPKVLAQDEPTAASTARWIGAIRSAAAHLASPSVRAQENARCERCPVRTSCPLQNEGRQVIG